MRSCSSSSGTEGLTAKVAVDEGPASADDEAAVVRKPVLPGLVPAPEFETASETTAKEVTPPVRRAGPSAPTRHDNESQATRIQKNGRK